MKRISKKNIHSMIVDLGRPVQSFIGLVVLTFRKVSNSSNTSNGAKQIDPNEDM